jgi:methyl-accepting chemotaxis protein
MPDSRIEKLQTDFQALANIASELNAASDLLTRSIGVLDESLKKLSVGLTVWVTFSSRGDDDQPHLYDLDQVGYCKVNGTWGLAIRNIWGDESSDWQKEDGPWLFNDAPRELRLRSVDQIPAVIAKLAESALETTKRIQKKTQEVMELAKAITDVAKPKAAAVTLAERVASQLAAGKSALDESSALKTMLGQPGNPVHVVGGSTSKDRK